MRFYRQELDMVRLSSTRGARNVQRLLPRFGSSGEKRDRASAALLALP